MNNLKISFIFLILFFSQIIFANSKWELIRNEKNMKVYTREVKGTSIKELKAEAIITGTIKEAETILFDRKDHPNIFKYIIKSIQIKRDKNCDWSYNVISPPLASNRDYLVKSCVKIINKKEHKVIWEPFTDSKYPKKSGFVRVTINEGYWLFKQIAPDTLKINYYIKTDPAGSLPSFIKNMANKKAVPQTIWSLYKEIMRRRKSKPKN